jgi:hypothetical protein
VVLADVSNLVYFPREPPADFLGALAADFFGAAAIANGIPGFIPCLLDAAFGLVVFLLCIIIILTSLLVLVNEIKVIRFVDRLAAYRQR